MSLSASQQDALEQLLAVTASNTPGARERDERLLRENGWNVQVTVEQIFSLGSTASEVPNDVSASNSSSARSSTSNPRSIPARFDVDDQNQDQDQDHELLLPRQPVGSRRLSGSQRSPRSSPGTSGVGLGLGSGSGLWGLITWPISMVLGLVGNMWYFIIRTFIPLSFLRRLPSFLLPPSSSSNNSNSGSNSHLRTRQDPTTTSLRFIRELEIFTRCSNSTGTLPDFYIGPYREFINHIKKEGKLGLVVIVSGEHENDEEFKRDILCDEEFIQIIKEKEVIIWGSDISTREGYQVAQTLLLTTYPSLTFISLLPVPNSSTPKLTILSNLSGSPSTTTSTSNIIQTLTTSILPRVTPFLNRLKRERLSLEEARHLRAEQDKAFKEAERKDKEKAQIQKQKEQLEKIQNDRIEKQQNELKKYNENLKYWRRYARRCLLPTFTTTSTGSGSGSGSGSGLKEESVRVALRTPLSSERHIKQFKISNSTIPLFIFAETLLIPSEDLPEDDPDTPLPPPPSSEDEFAFEPKWEFRLVTSFPRKEIDPTDIHGEDFWNIIKNAGGALFVERKEGSSWGLVEGEDSDEEIIDD
ncbi:uncharacterized protein IL334_006119 [Kwoniella shivajii]|uniref:UAS domain-containing protein n=1 Tax=Kwoniella shivajii TaxID=564305 RepID=A0ABZ1D5E2_9TREE|nr:hypothetical protein IL334_006119 [Kwoniella shivajii]